MKKINVKQIIFLMIFALLASFINVSALAQATHGDWANRPVVHANHFAVVSNNPQSTAAGMLILTKGGNAFDAVVATLAALGVVEPSHSGIGGENFLLAKPANEDKVTAVNGGGTAPYAATIDWYLSHNHPIIPSSGFLASVTPSALDSWVVTLDKWGTMSLAEVLQPAIELAENGFPVSDLMASRWASSQKKLSNYESSAKLYYPEGKAPEAGEIMFNKDLANTMKRLVEAEQKALAEGKTRSQALAAARDRFYKGDIAEEFVAYSKAHDYLYTLEDMADYHALIETPAHTTYRGYDVYKCASANQGPAELVALNILEGFDTVALGFNTPEYIHTAIESINFGYAAREKYLGDLAFIQAPLNGMLSKEYAADRRALIDPNKRQEEWPAGDAEQFDKPTYKYDGYPYDFGGNLKVSTMDNNPVAVSYTPKELSEEEMARALAYDAEVLAEYNLIGGHTSYAAVIDADRNMVSSTPSLFSGFGCGEAVDGLGFILNNRGSYFWLDPDHPNALEPGKRPRNTISPSMAMKDGKPFMAYGTPCGDCQPQVLMQILVNIVDFGMTIQDAIEAPHFTSSCLPGSSGGHTANPGRISVEGRIPEDVVNALKEKGWDINVANDYSSSFGGANAIMILPNGSLAAGSDPRREGYAMGW